MSRESISRICAGLPGAVVSQPFGPGTDVWKVGGKIFALVAAEDDGVSLKTQSADDAAFLIEIGRAVRAPYFHRSWIKVLPDVPSEDELRDRILASYGIVRAGLARKAQAALDPVPDKA